MRKEILPFLIGLFIAVAAFYYAKRVYNYYHTSYIEQDLDNDCLGNNEITTMLWHNGDLVYMNTEKYKPDTIDSLMTAEYNKAKKVQNALKKR